MISQGSVGNAVRSIVPSVLLSSPRARRACVLRALGLLLKVIKQVQIPSTWFSSEITIATKGRHSCPRSIFGSGPKSRTWIRWGSRCPCQRDSETPLSLYHPEHLPKPYSHLSQRPKLISKQIQFLICIWMRAWSAVIHYRAWLCGLRHKSGSQRCHPVQGLLCANWFFAPSICPHLISSWNDTLHRPRKIEGKHRRYILHHE